MPILITLLRGINVSGRSIVKMDQLRALCARMGLRNARTYIQSGNIVCNGEITDIAERLPREMESAFGVRTFAVVRTLEQLRGVAGRNPFPGADPKKLLVYFLTGEPTAASVAEVAQMEISPEEVQILGEEMFIFFPLGQGVSKLPLARIEKTLGVTGTGRNWNTVLALLAMAEEG